MTIASAILIVIAIVYFTLRSRKDNATATAPPSTTTPATRAAAGPVSPPPAPEVPPAARSFMDVVLANHPALPTTRPLALPLDPTRAAHLVIRDPLYLSEQRELWVTRADAEPTEAVLRKASEESDHVVRERVLYVHWLPQEDGKWLPSLVVPAAGGAAELVSVTGRRPLGSGRDYRWDRARSWNERLVVPTSTGVSVFLFAPDLRIAEAHQDLTALGTANAPPDPTSRPTTSPATGPAYADPQTMLDWQGMLAWIPWEEGKRGSVGAARFLNDKWSTLTPANGWPEKALHLIPLDRGSVMQVVLDDGASADGEEDGDGAPATGANGKPAVGQPIRLGVSDLDGAGVDRTKVATLVAKLSDEDEAVRNAAFEELARLGPAIVPQLREVAEDEQGPEAAARMQQLLRNQVKPLLGSMVLLENRLKLISRHRDGGVVLYADAGVSIADPDGGEPINRVPAWLAIRPGQRQNVELLTGALVHDLVPGKAQVLSHSGEWVVISDVRGPRQFIGNDTVQLLRKDEQAYSEWLGVDRRGRWLFRKPEGTAGEETLVIDPTIPDFTPRLPIWNYRNAKVVGWDKDNWPAVEHIGKAKLTEDGWVGLEKDEVLLSRRDQIPATLPATRPTSSPTTAATTQLAAAVATAEAPALTTAPSASTAPSAARSDLPTDPAPDASRGEPLLTLANGTRYYDGTEKLRVVTPNGRETTWSLPAIATGQPGARLIRTADGRLYLFNQPGRILRIKPTPAAAEPFTIEATFTRNVPVVSDPTRIWLDPAGRIIMAHENQLAIMFPSGYIPPVLRQRIANPEEADGEEGMTR